MERIVAALFIVGFFSALPLWGLSMQRGWVTLVGTRDGPAEPFQVTIVRRNAFSTSREVLEVVGAHADFIEGGRAPRRSAGTVVFVLETQDGGHYEVMRSIAAFTLSIPSTMAPVKAWANLINTARGSGQTGFTIKIAPEGSFWLVLGMTVIFAAVGLVIALMGGSSATVKPQ